MSLDHVWWLVAPQNPLKPEAPSLARRVRQATHVAAVDHRITVTGLEATLGTRYTADTLRILRRKFPRIRFVWLMGADNLAQIDRWKDWTQIFELVTIAVFARPSYAARALSGVAASRYAKSRRFGRSTRSLACMTPPAWAYFASRLDPVSSSELRSRMSLRE
jgi:nicotinate-nucleotide adenylyltransferase